MPKVFWFLLLVSLLCASAVLSPAWLGSPAYGQTGPQCGAFADLLADMQEKYGETEIWSGTIQSGGGADVDHR